MLNNVISFHRAPPHLLESLASIFLLSLQVEEDVNPSKAGGVEDTDLDDLISAAMGDTPNEDTQPQENKRSTSTPSKDDGGMDKEDFGGFLSMIRDDSEPPPPVEDKKNGDQPRDGAGDRRSGPDYDISSKRWSGGKVGFRSLMYVIPMQALMHCVNPCTHFATCIYNHFQKCCGRCPKYRSFSQTRISPSSPIQYWMRRLKKQH